MKEFKLDTKKVAFETERFLGKQSAPKQQETSNQPRNQPAMAVNPYQDLTPCNNDDAADFFSKLGTVEEPKPEPTIERRAQKPTEEIQAAPTGQVLLSETVSKNANWDEGPESMIKRNIMFGNLEYAAEVALKCGRVAEAFLIA
jgi:hypothetical protein